MTRHYRLIALPGEGIGPEVVEAALTVLQQLAQRHGFSVAIDRGFIGQPALLRYGSYFPDATAQLCEGADGILTFLPTCARFAPMPAYCIPRH
jgi:isocitrate/isopropylmalate dehydrogenase